MKGGIVAMLYAILALKECGAELNGRIALTLVPNEEREAKAARQWLAAQGRLGRGGIGMLLAEPTSGTVWNANRGGILERSRRDACARRFSPCAANRHGGFRAPTRNEIPPRFAFHTVPLVGSANSMPIRRGPIVPAAASHAEPPSPPVSSLGTSVKRSCHSVRRHILSAREWHRAWRQFRPSVARAAAKQEMVFTERLELLPGLRGNDVIMSVKVENASSPSIGRNQTDGAVARSLFRITSLQALAFKAALTQPVFQKIGASAIILPRWVLRRYGDKLGQQRSHLVLALTKPSQESARSALRLRSFAHSSAVMLEPAAVTQAPYWCMRCKTGCELCKKRTAPNRSGP